MEGHTQTHGRERERERDDGSRSRSKGTVNRKVALFKAMMLFITGGKRNF
jgi:hypothetical protein